MNLVFASSNINKLIEIRNVISNGYNILSLLELGYYKELEETTDTLEGNALQKARFAYENYGINCFADDSGLEVDALGGKPGVNSAHYAGLPRNDQQNIRFLLSELEKATNRRARFRTVIALIFDGKEMLFNGELIGSISIVPSGKNGFGYDPVFIPEDSSITLAEMSMEAKNIISHRSRAVQQLVAYLSTLKS